LGSRRGPGDLSGRVFQDREQALGAKAARQGRKEKVERLMGAASLSQRPNPRSASRRALLRLAEPWGRLPASPAASLFLNQTQLESEPFVRYSPKGTPKNSRAPAVGFDRFTALICCEKFAKTRITLPQRLSRSGPKSRNRNNGQSPKRQVFVPE